MTIIRTQAAVTEASTADLLESYNAFTGKDIKKFASREAAERQTSNAILAAIDASGKLGVKKGQKPVAMTLTELEAARSAKAQDSAGAAKPQQGAAAAQEANAATPAGKSLRTSLKAKAVGEPNKPKVKPQKPEGAGRAPKVTHVEIVPEGGRSKMQVGSQRKAIMDAIVGKAKNAKSISVTGREDKVRCVSIDLLQEEHREPVRGHVLKLIFEGHLRAVQPVEKEA